MTDYQSEAFWRWAIEHCDGRSVILARWFNEVGRQGWETRRKSAMDKYSHLAWPHLTRTTVLNYPPSPPDGWPVLPEESCEDIPLASVEERVARDREVMRLRNHDAEMTAKYQSAIRQAEIEDRIIEHMERIVPALPSVPTPILSSRSPGRPETAIMVTSDYHLGEVVSLEETGGLAHYDWETAGRRWQHHVDSVGSICFGKLTGYDFGKLVIPMLGDMVSGIIHDELRETADGTPVEWVCDGGHLFAQGIRQLASEFPEIVVDCVIGNHGRFQKQVRFKKRYVSFDYLMYRFIELELRDVPNVTVNVHKSFYSLVSVPGATMLNIHGDNIKSWAGIPWYGINRAVTNLGALLNAQHRGFDLVNLGHFHNAGTLDRIDCELVLNGSAVGGNEFSIGALFASTRPAQVLYGVHPERGKTWEFKLDLSHGDTEECRFVSRLAS